MRSARSTGLNPDQLARKKRKLSQNHFLSLAVGFIDSLDIATIFAMFYQDFLHIFLEEMGKFIFFPLAAAASLTQAVLAWRAAKLDEWKPQGVIRALVETGAALAITTAVVGSLAFTAVMGSVAPIIFTAVLGAKTLFHAGAACFYWGKARSATDPEEKKRYYDAVKTNAISAFAGALATVAIGCVMLGGKWSMAAFGIAAGVAGAGFTLYKGIQLIRQHRKKKSIITMTPIPEDESPELGSAPRPQLHSDARMLRSMSSSSLENRSRITIGAKRAHTQNVDEAVKHSRFHEEDNLDRADAERSEAPSKEDDIRSAENDDISPNNRKYFDL